MVNVCGLSQVSNSTSQTVIEFVSNIVQSFEDNSYTLGVFLYLSNAFDTINHNILIQKS